MSNITFGVPQGSAFGPVLFLLYVNNIHRSSNQMRFVHCSAGGRGASVSACADLTNQLLSCGLVLHVLGKNTDTAIAGYRWTGVGRTPRPVLLTGAKKSGVPD